MTTKAPVAIRITRPYQTEEEFFANELDTISRTGVMLVGAQPRPEGVVLRFELALASGAPLLRGEGRVIGYKAIAFGSEPGLSLRFTRLDSKSKSLVDRVGVMRETRRSIPPPPISRPKEITPPPQATHTAPVAPSEPSMDAIPISHESPVSSADPIPVVVASSPELDVRSGPALVQAAVGPRDRDGTLARLRQRAAAIGADDLGRILADGAARRRR